MPFPTKLILPITLILLPFIIGCGRDEHIETLIIGPYKRSVQVFLDQIVILNLTRKAKSGIFSMKAYKDLTLNRGLSGRCKSVFMNEKKGCKMWDGMRIAS